MYILTIIKNTQIKSKIMKKFINSLLTRNENISAWVFILPSVIGCLVFIIIPIAASFLLSFTEWNLLSKPEFIGFRNYTDLLSSKDFWLVFNNTIIFALATTILGTIIPLVLATIINSKIKGSEFFKTTYFIPFVTPMIVIAMVWEWIFDPKFGLLNYLLKSNIEWLYDTHTALFAIIIVSVWKLVGYNMIIFLSGFSTINSQVLESAKIDGSGKLTTFFKIIIPLLSPTIFFVLIITTISSFQVFDLIYLMTQGGPENSTNVLVYWLYKNAFEFFNIGKASAIAYILFIFISILTITQWIIRKRWVYNE